MTFVIDSSVALAWVYVDERNEAVDRILGRVAESGAWAPGIWRLEIANSFQRNIRRQRIVRSQRDRAVAKLLSLPISIDLETDGNAWGRTLALADEFGLTTYDACYLELAERLGLPLATLDRELASAAGKRGLAFAG